MRTKKVIDVSDLSPKQIALIEEIIKIFKQVTQYQNKSQDFINHEKSQLGVSLDQRIKQRFAHLESLEIPPITRDKMRTPPTFD